jgi:hypothetical protein
MKERKQKTLIYKRANFHADGPVLKKALEAALTKHPTVGTRRESLAPEGESPIWRLIGQFRIESEFVFGILMRYVPGTNPAFVVDDESASTLTVEQLSAPVTDDGKRRELVEGMLFFGVIDNHLVMMQSSALRSDHLETHLQWLLHAAGSLEETNSIQLIDQLPKHVREKLSQEGVRAIDIGGALMPATVITPPTESGVAAVSSKAHITTESLTVTEEASSQGILSTIKSLMAPDKAAKIDMDALAGSNIEYTLNIRYRRTTTDDGQKVMDTLGAALRHAEGVQTKVTLVGGGELKGDDLRLSGPVGIYIYGGIPSADEVFEVMRSWLLEKLKYGDVKAS